MVESWILDSTGSQLHIKEFILFGSGGARIAKYGYNYSDKDGNLIFLTLGDYMGTPSVTPRQFLEMKALAV